ncbi:hypothetical protein [Lutibacter sp.]|uniref:hypothetical protein n=1 Tax=Lutibacter sp. TaxID=1925666 RepID=UPI0025BB0676|nr:hypothetical protein [Lutibacter sp.]MCF6182908.1 hypothetical protein [Lutibacter sp.]
MKKLLLSLVMISLLSEITFSQEKVENQGFKGAWWGLMSASYNKTEGSAAVYTILPAVGTFVSADVTIGAALGYTNALSQDVFIVKPLARKYFGVSDKFFLFIEGNVPLLFGENFNAYGFNIEPGIDYFIGGKWTIEAKFGRFGYNVFNPDGGSSVGTTTFGFNMFDSQTQEGLGAGLSFGLKYLF